MTLDDTTSRRRVLKLSGAAVAATVGAGTASADHTHADVETEGASFVRTTTATLNGELLDMGGASSVDVWFDWGLFGSDLPLRTATQPRTSPGGFTADLDFLTPDTAYQYRAVSDTGSVVSTGGVGSFRTNEEGRIVPRSNR